MKKQTVSGTIGGVIQKISMLAFTLTWAFAPFFVYAAAEAKWDAVIGFLVPWIARLGGVVMLIGGIMFGLAFKNDDADGKTRALQTLVAGAIVIAVGAGYTIFVS